MQEMAEYFRECRSNVSFASKAENHFWELQNAANEAVELLKEQEAVTEYVIDEFQPTCKACGFRPFAGYIPSLEWMRERGFRFCPKCGKKVKWDGRA